MQLAWPPTPKLLRRECHPPCRTTESRNTMGNLIPQAPSQMPENVVWYPNRPVQPPSPGLLWRTCYVLYESEDNCDPPKSFPQPAWLPALPSHIRGRGVTSWARCSFATTSSTRHRRLESRGGTGSGAANQRITAVLRAHWGHGGALPIHAIPNADVPAGSSAAPAGRLGMSWWTMQRLRRPRQTAPCTCAAYDSFTIRATNTLSSGRPAEYS